MIPWCPGCPGCTGCPWCRVLHCWAQLGCSTDHVCLSLHWIYIFYFPHYLALPLFSGSRWPVNSLHEEALRLQCSKSILSERCFFVYPLLQCLVEYNQQQLRFKSIRFLTSFQCLSFMEATKKSKLLEDLTCQSTLFSATLWLQCWCVCSAAVPCWGASHAPMCSRIWMSR